MTETKQIYEAIPAILSDVEAISKNRKNQQQGYSFRGIDDVYNAIHPLLAKHKVFPTCEILSRDTSERETKNGGTLFCVVLRAKYTLWASDGSNVTTEAVGEGMDSADKASNKAMSAAYKYALFQMLCIPTEAVDADEHTPEVAPRREPQKSPPKPAEPPPLNPKDAKIVSTFQDLLNEAFTESDLEAIKAMLKQPDAAPNTAHDVARVKREIFEAMKKHPLYVPQQGNQAA